MLNLLRRYTRWLHTGWPAGVVEKLPVVREDGSTRIPGLYVVGDLTGIPLLKFSSHTGALAVQTIVASGRMEALKGEGGEEVLDVVIVGGGVSGMAAALEAKKSGLRYQLLEASEPFSTIVNFPKGKPIFTYPTEMVPVGDLQFTAKVKEPLVEEIREQTLGRGVEPTIARVESIQRQGKLLEVVVPAGENLLARAVIVGIGRSGNFRKLGVPGEELDKVTNRLHDPKDYGGRDVLVVGGGDSALEAAIALAQCGARVTLSYRKPELTRPKPENVDKLMALAADPNADVAVEQPSSERVTTATGRYLKAYVTAGELTLRLGSKLKGIGAEDVTLTTTEGEQETLPNTAVFSMIGREAPLDFFRRSGVPIRGEVKGWDWFGLIAVALAFAFIYFWKAGSFYEDAGHWPKTMPALLAGLQGFWQEAVEDRSSLISVIAWSMTSRSFYYTLMYCVLMGVFGVRRIRRRKTPYVTVQTSALLAVQFVPLFLLPEVILPYMGVNGFWESGPLQVMANELFPLYGAGLSDTNPPAWGHPRAYWKAYGLILAWPLNVYNVFTPQPSTGWLVISFTQTFVIIPLLVWRFGKGAYCGWICSCGGMAETLGDTHRYKMPHGPVWNRVNMLGQVILLIAFVLLVLRVFGWVFPDSGVAAVFPAFLDGTGSPAKYLSYKWLVDIGLGGVLGFGLYFHFSGRMWCRFACPLAALMHIYARFSQFRIIPEKKKCISCNVCTSVCHQGIDVMSFANKGMPMEDPECVRCSACVQSCPTGVLRFGRVDPKTGDVLAYDRLAASPVQMAEKGKSLPVV